MYICRPHNFEQFISSYTIYNLTGSGEFRMQTKCFGLSNGISLCYGYLEEAVK